jgi:hypothetical protein
VVGRTSSGSRPGVRYGASWRRSFASDSTVSLVTLPSKTSLQPDRIALLASLLNDIKSERAKIAEKDHLRLLHVTKWFLTFFRLVKAATGEGHIDVSFGMVAEITERGWIAWVLKRMREAVDTKV